MSDAGWDGYPVGKQFQRRQLNALSSTQHRLPGTWITAEHEIIEIGQMKNSHLRNTIEMLRRNSLRKLARRDLEAIALGVSDYSAVEIMDIDARASAAWGEVYDELISEALFRSDGDLEEWMQR